MKITTTRKRPIGTYFELFVAGEPVTEAQPLCEWPLQFHTPYGICTLDTGPTWSKGEIDGHEVKARKMTRFEEYQHVEETEGNYDPRMGLNICPACGEYVIDGYCGCDGD